VLEEENPFTASLPDEPNPFDDAPQILENPFTASMMVTGGSKDSPGTTIIDLLHNFEAGL
jgi:hypothetical protein